MKILLLNNAWKLFEIWWNSMVNGQMLSNHNTAFYQSRTTTPNWNAVWYSAEVNAWATMIWSSAILMHKKFVSKKNSFVLHWRLWLIILKKKTGRSLVFSIRLSMKEVSAGWTKNFSGYIVSLLVIFYFQSIKQLPPAKDLGSIYSLHVEYVSVPSK